MAQYLDPVGRVARWLAIIGLGLTIPVLLVVDILVIVGVLTEKAPKPQDLPMKLGVSGLLGLLTLSSTLLFVRLLRGTTSPNGVTLLPLWVIRVFGAVLLAAAPFIVWNRWPFPLAGIGAAGIGFAMLFIGRLVDASKALRGLGALQADSVTSQQQLQKIIRVLVFDAPPGAVPEWIRRSWIGLELPLRAGETGPRMLPVDFGATGLKATTARIWSLFSGRPASALQYVIPFDSALTILESNSPEAAEWWRKNNPALVGVGAVFLFAAEVCSEVASK